MGACQMDQHTIRFTFWSVKVSCLLPTALSGMLLVPECSSNLNRSSNEALQDNSKVQTFSNVGYDPLPQIQARESDFQA